MEHIRKAVERAKDDRVGGNLNMRQPHPPSDPHFGAVPPAAAPAVAQDVTLDAAYLESKRIIAHDIADFRSRSFDMLRTQILQSMDMRSWQFLGITSATEGCGKSVVAVNLALSIARQPERSVLLVDLDLQKPQVANYLGLNCERGILSVLAGRASLQDVLVQARIRNGQALVLPCESRTANSSAWIASRAMSALLQDIKRSFANWTVVFDLPPTLASDDVISILPRLDCVAFVVGAGTTTTEEIKECNKHLESAEIVRVILNKAEDGNASYYYSYPRPVGGARKEQSDAAKPLTPKPLAPKPVKSGRMSRLIKRLGER